MAGVAIIEVEQRGAVQIWTLNHPPVNAISLELLEELTRLLDSVASDDDTRAIVLTGSGVAFAAGADVSGFMKLGDQLPRFLQLGAEVFQRVETFAKPVVAAINGLALGGGNELAMAADIRIASPAARFGQPEVNLGIIPGWGGTVRMARLVGRSHAAQLILTGDPIDADEAYRIGLVTRVVAPELLLASALNLAERLASLPPLALASIKGLLAAQNLEGAQERETQEILRLMTTQDAMEGVLAFMQKRRPRFGGQ